MQFLLRLCPITDKVSPRKCHASICNHHAPESMAWSAGLCGGGGASAESYRWRRFSVDARRVRIRERLKSATHTPCSPLAHPRALHSHKQEDMESASAQLCPLLSQRSICVRHQPTAPPARSPLQESKHNSP